MSFTFRFTYWCVYGCFRIGFLLSGYNLFSEEAQYWLWSKHPDWAYYSKPPLIAWVNLLTSSIFGSHELVIRLTALAFGAATLYVLYKVSLLLFNDKLLASLATMILSIMPYFMLASTFFTTDSLLLFFWVTTTYFFLKALQHNTFRYWLLTGLSFGLGCLSKQAMLFFLLFLLVPFFVRGGKRYLGGQALVLVMVLAFNLPQFWWNYHHNRIMERHLMQLAGAGSEMVATQTAKNLAELFGGFILMNSPFFLLLLLRVLSFRFRPFPAADKQKLTLLFIPTIGSLLLFSCVALVKRVEANWYNIGCLLLPIGIAYLVVQEKRFRQARIAFCLTGVCWLFFLYPVLQDYTGLSRIVPVRRDGLKRLAGWQQLGQQVRQLSTKHATLAPFQITGVDYQVTSLLAFYSGNTNVRCICDAKKYNQFVIWSAIGWPRVPQNTIFVTDKADLPAHLYLHYDLVESQQVPIIYRKQVLYTYTIYVLRAKPTSSYTVSRPPPFQVFIVAYL
jgi:4-amino-4-deoxy-L-arabinose transferase-like glycosyltransferase